MTISLSRRGLLALSLPLATAVAAGCESSQAAQRRDESPSATRMRSAAPTIAQALPSDVRTALSALERRTARRIGVDLFEPGIRHVGYRAAERFAMCSTYKVFAVSSVLHGVKDLDEIIRFSHSDLVDYSPVTKAHVRTGMSITDLCAAAIEVSDNTAANLLLRRAGGPAAVTSFLRDKVHDATTRLDRYEPAVNEYVRGDSRDTSTPTAMALDYARLTSSTLSAERTERLREWLIGCTTGRQQIRAVAPRGWTAGDKTGHGDHGTANDVALLTAPNGRTALTLAVLTDARAKKAANRDDVVREAARITLRGVGIG